MPGPCSLRCPQWSHVRLGSWHSLNWHHLSERKEWRSSELQQLVIFQLVNDKKTGRMWENLHATCVIFPSKQFLLQYIPRKLLLTSPVNLRRIQICSTCLQTAPTAGGNLQKENAHEIQIYIHSLGNETTFFSFSSTKKNFSRKHAMWLLLYSSHVWKKSEKVPPNITVNGSECNLAMPWKVTAFSSTKVSEVKFESSNYRKCTVHWNRNPHLQNPKKMFLAKTCALACRWHTST